jgi:hypothetical protein
MPREKRRESLLFRNNPGSSRWQKHCFFIKAFHFEIQMG